MKEQRISEIRSLRLSQSRDRHELMTEEGRAEEEEAFETRMEENGACLVPRHSESIVGRSSVGEFCGERLVFGFREREERENEMNSNFSQTRVHPIYILPNS